MKIEVLRQSKMTVSGNAVLKMIQNNSIPNLDLVVRESIQNSMDAVAPGQNCVRAQFIHNLFNVSDLAQNFEFIGDEISKKFKRNMESFLAIRDFNTVGLTGSISADYDKNEESHNLAKLVFHIMKAQESEGAGGSWGIGKSVYYRLGIGLTTYYSRVKLESGRFEERLVAALIEDENKKGGLLAKDPKNLGVAFFGEEMKEEPSAVQAITNEEYIHKFLKIFNIQPYSGDQTGTTIIIPFINNDELLNNTKGEEDSHYLWSRSVEEYISMSILRWYFPRMSSKYPYGARLVPIVNEKVLTVDNVDGTLFKKMTELYDACYSDDYPEWITKEPIKRNANVEENILGYFSYGKLTSTELKMIRDHLPDPYAYCLLDDKAGMKNSPIVSFVRKPGMVVNYQEGGLSIGAVKSDKDEFIIGVFSLNSNNKIVNPVKMNLDEYIRQSEKADHTTWDDHEIVKNHNKVLIVRSIFTGINNILSNAYLEFAPVSGNASINKNFAKKFGKLLMPDEGFGKSGSSRHAKSIGGRAGGGTIITKSKNKILFMNKKFNGDSVELEYKLEINSKAKNITICNYINSINGSMSTKKYEDYGLEYPCYITKAFYKIEKYIRINSCYQAKSINFDGDKLAHYDITALKTNDRVYGLKLSNSSYTIEPITFVIKFQLKTTDNFVQSYFDFDIEEDE